MLKLVQLAAGDAVDVVLDVVGATRVVVVVEDVIEAMLEDELDGVLDFVVDVVGTLFRDPVDGVTVETAEDLVGILLQGCDMLASNTRMNCVRTCGVSIQLHIVLATCAGSF